MAFATKFAVLALLLCASCAFAEDAKPSDKPSDKVDPVQNAIAGAAGAAIAPTLTGLPPAAAQVVAANGILAQNALNNVNTQAGRLVGGLLSKPLGLHRTAGQLLVQIVDATNSLAISKINAAAGLASNKLATLVQNIKDETLAIGGIYTQLLTEFGRFVGASLTAHQTLKSSLNLPNPLLLPVNHLESSLNKLITFLQAAVSPSVATPDRAVAFAPFIATLQGVRAVLLALQTALAGPQAAVANALNGATNAANAVLGGAGALGAPAAGPAGLSQLVTQALGLLNQVPGLPALGH